MPSAKKVAWAQLRTGIMAIAAMTILAILIFLLTGSGAFLTQTVTIYTYLDDSAALAKGSPVRLNGIVIGSVENVDLSGLADPRKVVRVDMSVRRDRLSSIPIDSRAEISAENVLGTKYINIRMGRSGVSVKPGGTIESVDTMEFPEVVQSGYNVMVSAQALLKRLDAIVSQVEAGKGSIGKFLSDDEFYNRLTGTVSELQKVTSAVSSGKGTVGRLLYDESLYEQVRSTVNRLDAVIQEVQEGRGTAGKLIKDQALYDEIKTTVAEMRRMMEDLNAGKGTAGKLLKDEEAYRQISRTLSKIEATLDRLQQGEGTLGQLMVNPQLYESINGATGELRSLLKDIRANPKKFLRIKMSLF